MQPKRFYIRREKTSLFLFHRVGENGSANVRKSCCDVIVEENEVKEINKPEREERTLASFVKLVGFYGCISKLNDLIKASSRQKSRDEIDVSILTRELRRLGHRGSKRFGRFGFLFVLLETYYFHTSVDILPIRAKEKKHSQFESDTFIDVF